MHKEQHMTRNFKGARIALALLLGLAARPAVAQSSGHNFSHGFIFQERSGEEIFQNVCQGCHMPQAQGASGAGAYPALAGNPRLSSKVYPAYMVLNGNKAMPSFAMGFDDEQVAAVVNYVRTHFGNNYQDVLTPAEVKALRPKPQHESE
jgi:mono/diheme cytochrome c family protein